MDAVPEKIEEVDAAWLQAALAPRFPGVRVRAVRIRDQRDATNSQLLPGAQILVVRGNTSRSFYADPRGNFQIDVPHGKTRFEVSLAGYQTFRMSEQTYRGVRLTRHIRLQPLAE